MVDSPPIWQLGQLMTMTTMMIAFVFFLIVYVFEFVDAFVFVFVVVIVFVVVRVFVVACVVALVPVVAVVPVVEVIFVVAFVVVFVFVLLLASSLRMLAAGFWCEPSFPVKRGGARFNFSLPLGSLRGNTTAPKMARGFRIEPARPDFWPKRPGRVRT